MRSRAGYKHHGASEVSDVKQSWQQLDITNRILIYIAFVLTMAFLASIIEKGLS